jgi:hypothetical protein
MTDTRINRPGAPTNPPHAAREGTAISDYVPADTGADGQTIPPGPAAAPRDHDPHPSNEGHPYREKHPGGAHPPKTDIGPNPAVHTGTPEPKPDNADHGPRYAPS